MGEKSTNFFGKSIGSAIVVITALHMVCQEISEELIGVLSILLSTLLSGAPFNSNENNKEIILLLKFVDNNCRLQISEALAISAKQIMARQQLAVPGWVNVIPIIYILTGDQRCQPVKWKDDLLYIPKYDSLKDSRLSDSRYFHTACF